MRTIPTTKHSKLKALINLLILGLLIGLLSQQIKMHNQLQQVIEQQEQYNPIDSLRNEIINKGLH